MKNITYDYSATTRFIASHTLDHALADARRALDALLRGTCPGNDYLGWLTLPADTPDSLLDRLGEVAGDLRQRAETTVVIGIGGSYLGARAVIDALSDPFQPLPPVLFAGQNLGEDYLAALARRLRGHRFALCVISKSGTTTEPAIAFRVLREQLLAAVGRDEARRLVVAVTDARRGALRAMADREGYPTFVIPDNVGGRYSVLTPVGLLPVALAGLDHRALVRGAADMARHFEASAHADPLAYAAARNALLRAGYRVELTVNYDPRLHNVGEWWKQLFGESEGKQGLGLFPAAADFTTDLHSLGQYIQEGPRQLFETVLSVDQPAARLTIPTDADNLDGLNYLAGKRVDHVNKMAEQGTRQAHVDGGVPNARILIPRLDEYYLGQLFYFYELSCAVSGIMLGVNPFDQPGVEAYKRAMFRLLGKPC